MTSDSSPAQHRAKQAWERIFTLIANDQPVQAGSESSTDATSEELRASLVVTAMALDELYETGTLQPEPQLRLLESMRNLLLVLDSLTPLPKGLVPATDLDEVLDAIREARGQSAL